MTIEAIRDEDLLLSAKERLILAEFRHEHPQICYPTESSASHYEAMQDAGRWRTGDP